QFNTAQFCVALAWQPESDPDLSWADDADRAKLDDGTWVNATFWVTVTHKGKEVARDALGNSVYADVRDFYREHLGIRAKSRADGRNYGCYFSDMVANAIAEARRYVAAHPDPAADLVREMRDELAEVHDTHVYADDDEHPDDCRLCALIARADAWLV